MILRKAKFRDDPGRTPSESYVSLQEPKRSVDDVLSVENVANPNDVVAVSGVAGAVVVGVGSPAVLDALEVCPGGGVVAEGGDVGVELFGAVAEEVLLELDEEEEGEEDGGQSGGGDAEGSIDALRERVWHRAGKCTT